MYFVTQKVVGLVATQDQQLTVTQHLSARPHRAWYLIHSLFRFRIDSDRRIQAVHSLRGVPCIDIRKTYCKTRVVSQFLCCVRKMEIELVRTCLHICRNRQHFIYLRLCAVRQPPPRIGRQLYPVLRMLTFQHDIRMPLVIQRRVPHVAQLDPESFPSFHGSGIR